MTRRKTGTGKSGATTRSKQSSGAKPESGKTRSKMIARSAATSRTRRMSTPQSEHTTWDFAFKALKAKADEDGGKSGVLLALDRKSIALFDAEKELRDRHPQASENQKGAIWDALMQAVNEALLVDARISAIRAGDAFHAPGGNADQDLLNAIQLVGRFADGAGAINGLVTAVIDLVKVYRADDTK